MVYRAAEKNLEVIEKKKVKTTKRKRSREVF